MKTGTGQVNAISQLFAKGVCNTRTYLLYYFFLLLFCFKWMISLNLRHFALAGMPRAQGRRRRQRRTLWKIQGLETCMRSALLRFPLNWEADFSVTSKSLSCLFREQKGQYLFLKRSHSSQGVGAAHLLHSQWTKAGEPLRTSVSLSLCLRHIYQKRLLRDWSIPRKTSMWKSFKFWTVKVCPT